MRKESAPDMIISLTSIRNGNFHSLRWNLPVNSAGNFDHKENLKLLKKRFSSRHPPFQREKRKDSMWVCTDIDDFQFRGSTQCKAIAIVTGKMSLPRIRQIFVPLGATSTPIPFKFNGKDIIIHSEWLGYQVLPEQNRIRQFPLRVLYKKINFNPFRNRVQKAMAINLDEMSKKERLEDTSSKPRRICVCKRLNPKSNYWISNAFLPFTGVGYSLNPEKLQVKN